MKGHERHASSVAPSMQTLQLSDEDLRSAQPPLQPREPSDHVFCHNHPLLLSWLVDLVEGCLQAYYRKALQLQQLRPGTEQPCSASPAAALSPGAGQVRNAASPSGATRQSRASQAATPHFSFPNILGGAAATPAPFAAQPAPPTRSMASTPPPPLLSGSPQHKQHAHDTQAADIALKIAQCCRELQDAKGAVAELEAIPDDLRGPAVYCLLGELHQELGNKKSAEHAFKVRSSGLRARLCCSLALQSTTMSNEP